MRRRRLACWLSCSLLLGCDAAGFGQTSAPDAGASPEASMVPPPLATVAPLDAGSPGRAADADTAGLDAEPPPPTPFELGEALEAETPVVRELSGVTVALHWRWRNTAGSAKSATPAFERARALSSGAWQVRLSTTGRMRASFMSRGLPLPEGSALLARADRYGNVLLWPDDARYRVLPPGVLRTTLGERRVDVNPLARSRPSTLGDSERLGYRTRKLELSSPYATVRLDLAAVPEAGAGGPLLCRLLVEVAGVDPSTEACVSGELPLAADYSWHGRDGSGILVEVTAVSRQNDLLARELAVPPDGARAAGTDFPPLPGGRFFDDAELSSWRAEDGPAPAEIDPRAPASGLVAVNRADMPMYLLVDGVPVGIAAPWTELALPALRRGRYALQWRSFLGETVGDVFEAELPARVVWGVEEPIEPAPDAG